MAQVTRQSTAAAVRREAWPLRGVAQLGSDLLLIFSGFWLAYVLRYRLEIGGETAGPDYRPFEAFLPVMALLGAILLAVFAVRGLYRLPRWTGLLDEALLIANSAVLGFGALIVIVFYGRLFYFSRLIFLFALVSVVTLLVAKRIAWHWVQAWMRSRGRWVDRVLIVGAGPAGARVMGALFEQPRLGYDVAGFVDDVPLSPQWAIATQRAVMRPARLGAVHDLPEVIGRAAIDEVIIALPATAHDQLRWVIEQCRAARVPFTLLPDLFELSLDRVEINELNGLPLIRFKDGSIRGWNFALKRAFDIAFAAAVLLGSLVPMLIIALLIRLDSPGPIIYGQRRIGREGRPFTFYKFRSMREGADEEKPLLAASASYTGDRIMFKLKDDPRRTRMGKWLRRTSLDEWPNFLNVLRGDMSVVGPRPHLPQEVAQYEPWQRQRLAITPGITCLWQVIGRSNLTFDEQVRLDLYYAEHWSLWLDIKIILRTIPAVLSGRGAY
ncbi:MAG: sugar transferase [Chloroflexota bacterium]|nr:sugar transferase [Chloroflexota bacterium]